MSALSVSTNPLLSQAAQTSQTQSAAPADDQQTPAFASVLKQQQAQTQAQGDESDNKSTSQDAATANSAQTPATTQNAAKDDSTEASSTTATDDATTALQQLLPWLQAIQGKTSDSLNAKSDKKTLPTDTTATTDANTALQQAAALALQTQTTNQAADNKNTSQDAGADPQGTGTLTAQTSAETASAAAKLAATEAPLANDDKPQSDNSNGFNTALNAASAAGQTAQSAQNTQAATTASQPTQMQSALGTPQWQDELGNRVQLMSNNNESRAELVLTPPQLGRIEVSLHVSGDQASATFVSANPDVRNALQNSMDHLRQVLAGSGISLGQTHVGAESSGQAFSNSQGGQRGSGRSSDSANDDTVQSTSAASTVWTRQSNNMLDVFA